MREKIGPTSDLAWSAFAVVVAVLYWVSVLGETPPTYSVAEALINSGLAAAVILRNMRPIASLVLAGACFTALALLDASTPIRLSVTPLMVAAPLVLFSVTFNGPSKVAGRIGLAAGILGSAFSPLVRESEAPGWAFAAHVCIIVVAWLWGQRRRSLRADRRRELREARAEARRAERLRLSSELHDVVGHGLTVISMQASRGLGADEATLPSDVRRHLSIIRTSTQQTLAEMRQLVDALADHEQALSVKSIPAIVERTQLSGTPIHHELPPAHILSSWDAELSGEVRSALIRVVQEGLTNALRHGDSSPVGLLVEEKGSMIHCEVRNRVARSKAWTDDARPEGRGLKGIKRRVEMVGGQTVTLRMDDVFILDVFLPRGLDEAT